MCPDSMADRRCPGVMLLDSERVDELRGGHLACVTRHLGTRHGGTRHGGTKHLHPKGFYNLARHDPSLEKGSGMLWTIEKGRWLDKVGWFTRALVEADWGGGSGGYRAVVVSVLSDLEKEERNAAEEASQPIITTNPDRNTPHVRRVHAKGPWQQVRIKIK